MISSYMLFTTPFCKFCPTIKEFLHTTPLHGTVIDATQDEGNEKANNLNVSKVPTAIFFDNQGNEIGRAHNVSDIRNILSDD